MRVKLCWISLEYSEYVDAKVSALKQIGDIYTTKQITNLLEKINSLPIKYQLSTYKYIAHIDGNIFIIYKVI